MTSKQAEKGSEMKSCERCGEEFPVIDGRYKRKRFCSENCRKRFCDERHRGVCEDCGMPTASRSGWPSERRSNRWCSPCYRQRELKRTAQRGHQIEEWWAEGRSLREIADRLGWSKGQLSVQMDRLRAKGFDLPYRRRGVKNGTKFPHLKKAA